MADRSRENRSLRRDRTPNPNSLLLSVSEAAAELRLSPMTVYVMIEAGELPAIRFGRAIRLSREALLTYIRAQTVDITGRLEA